jgi:hypothetical protein
METKICKKCNIEKKLEEYNKDKYSKDGYRYRCRECTSVEYKNFYYNNLDREIERQVNYQKNNKERVKSTRNKRHKTKYEKDLIYKLKINLRNRVKAFLIEGKFGRFSDNTFNIVGCSPEVLKKHIESQFKDGMSWENHKHDGWHIDHIVPLSSAKNKEDVYKLCHYTNLQPLWATENYKKGKKII